MGGMGADQLTGGADGDTFLFNFLSDSWAGAGNRDQILDFDAGTDEIDISAIDANLSVAGDQAFAVIGTGFTNTAGELRFEVAGSNTIIQIDRNGDGVADMEIEVVGVTSLTADDFTL
jgi:Ca2+-binding RTX toxin-like protein